MKNNKEKRINELLAGYFAATLSPVEEQELRGLYASGNVPPELSAYASLILMGGDESKEKMAENIWNTPDESELFEEICEANAARRRRKGIFAICGAVASVAAVIALVFTLMPRSEEISPVFNKADKTFAQTDTFHSLLSGEKTTEPALAVGKKEKNEVSAPAAEEKAVSVKKPKAVKKSAPVTYKEKAEVEEAVEENSAASVQYTNSVAVSMKDVPEAASDGAEDVMKRMECNRFMGENKENVGYAVI